MLSQYMGKIVLSVIFFIFFILGVSIQSQEIFEFDCLVAPSMSPPPPPNINMAEIEQIRKKVEDGIHKPCLIKYRELDFEHVGASMPQWSKNGEWLAVQAKTSSSKIPYQLHLFHFPNDLQQTYQRYLVQDQGKKSIFYALRWSQKKETSSEFCLLSGGFKLYWGKAQPNSEMTVYPLSQENFISQPNWFHTQDKDYIAFLQGSVICIGELVAPTEYPRRFQEVWSLPLSSIPPNIHSVSYFQAKMTPNGLEILVCGFSSKGENLHLVKVKNDLRTIERVNTIAEGTFKLPEWNDLGDRAIVYQVKRISNREDAQELYLYLYTPNGSGDILSRSPTIQNREKEPEHDYLGPSWAEWIIDGENIEGIAHFFKQSDIPQHFALIYFSNEKKQIGYQTTKLDMGTFPISFGRGRRIAFASPQNYRVAWTFFDAGKQKSIVLIGLINFPTK